MKKFLFNKIKNKEHVLKPSVWEMRKGGYYLIKNSLLVLFLWVPSRHGKKPTNEAVAQMDLNFKIQHTYFFVFPA